MRSRSILFSTELQYLRQESEFPTPSNICIVVKISHLADDDLILAQLLFASLSRKEPGTTTPRYNSIARWKIHCALHLNSIYSCLFELITNFLRYECIQGHYDLPYWVGITLFPFRNKTFFLQGYSMWK
jgi:hypothetical protein